MIMAAIQMADKPYFVGYAAPWSDAFLNVSRYSHCVPFDTPSRRGLRVDPGPLAGWRRAVEGEAQHGQDMLVHFCPINLNANHFTLLEINEREKKIYHYDSWASKDVISGHAKQTRVGKTVEVSIGSRSRH
jgi:Ulp1 family protease catalytic subunit